MKNVFKNLFDKYLILLLIIVVFIYWKWFVPGVRVATDFPIIPINDLRLQYNFPNVWFLRGSVGLGGYSVFTLWSWPIDFIAGALASFGFNFEILERIMLVIPTILVGILSIWKLLGQLKLSKISKFIASFFYISNTYILLLIDGGQLSIGLAFAWFPTAYLFFQQSIGAGLDKKILAGLGLWLLGILDIRFIYILSILLALRFLYELICLEKNQWKSLTWKWIKSLFVVFVIFTALNMYWIIPLIKYPLPSSKFLDLTKVSDSNFTTLKHSLTLLQPHWYENIFGKIPLFRKEFLLIPIFAFLAPFLKRKNKEVWFWTIVAVISIFLTKGANPPLSGVYPWLFANVPGFSLFRDSTKFFFLVAFSYSVLIAFTIESLIERFPKFKILFPVLVIFYLLSLSNPAYMSKMTGTFSEARYEEQHKQLASEIENDRDFGRIFWIPSRAPLGYASVLHSTLDASYLESIRPFAISTVGTYETQNFIREGNYIGELFDIIGVKYIVYPYFDLVRDNISKEKEDYYYTFLGQIENLPWVGEKVSDFPLPVFKTKKNQEKIFLSQNTYFIVGSDRIYSDIKNLEGNFSDNALIFVEENSGAINQIEKTPTAKILLYDKNLTDLILSFVDKDKFISPSSSLENSPNETGWWKRAASDLLWFRDFLQTKYRIDSLDFDYESGWGIAEGEKELIVTSELVRKDNILYARIMHSSKGGEISFYQGDRQLGKVDTKVETPQKTTIKLTGNNETPDRFQDYDKANFNWVKIGQILDDSAITIKTKGDINIVNSLVVISQKQEKEIVEVIDTLVGDGRVLEWEKLSLSDRKSSFANKNIAEVSYEILSPTHYKVNIKGLEGSTTLFFSDIFDKGWELNSKKGYKLYSFLNGFWVDKDGDYDLYYTPQKHVTSGLVVSALVLTSCIIILVWKKIKKRPSTLKKSL